MITANAIRRHRRQSGGCARRARATLARAAPSIFCETLEGIVKLELSEDEIAKLLESLGEGGGDPL
jgi:hypothetical protein